ncbi:MAG: penicillin acylase family protein, partial [Lysobacterales bacterium]
MRVGAYCRLAGFALAATAVLSACGGGNSDSFIAGGGSGSGPAQPPAAGSIFLNVVPPGANGNSAGGCCGPVPGVPALQYPPNFRDQLDLYGNLAYAQQGLKSDTCTPPKNIGEHQQKSDQACNYFKDHGLEPDSVVSTRELTAPNGKKVTIRRNGWGVPFINGEDRASAEYGLGFASAQDRLWLWDVLRNVGRGRASEFLGPASTIYDLDLQFGGGGGYSEEELTQLAEAAIAKIGPLGPIFRSDVEM